MNCDPSKPLTVIFASWHVAFVGFSHSEEMMVGEKSEFTVDGVRCVSMDGRYNLQRYAGRFPNGCSPCLVKIETRTVDKGKKRAIATTVAAFDKDGFCFVEDGVDYKLFAISCEKPRSNSAKPRKRDRSDTGTSVVREKPLYARFVELFFELNPGTRLPAVAEAWRAIPEHIRKTDPLTYYRELRKA